MIDSSNKKGSLAPRWNDPSLGDIRSAEDAENPINTNLFDRCYQRGLQNLAARSVNRARTAKNIRAKSVQVGKLFDSRLGWGGFGARNVMDAYSHFAAKDYGIQPIAVPKLFLRNADRDRANRYAMVRSEGGLSHCWLKEIAIAFFKSFSDERPYRELEMYGRRYDVAFPDIGVVVECGNSGIEAAMTALDEGWRYFLLPFSRAADRWFEHDSEPHVFMFHVTRGPIPHSL